MRATVFRIKYTKIILIAVLGTGIFFCHNRAFSKTMPPSLWDRWLDNAYKLTWYSYDDIDNWISENEKKIFKESLLTYVKKREKYSLKDQNQSTPLPDDFFRRLSIAEMLLYLQTKKIARLEKAAQIMQKNLQYKIELPEIAFWFHYIQAHLKMEQGDSKGFINHTYKIWIDIILKLEAAYYDFGTSGISTQLPGFYQSLPFLYRNTINLIISRAIIEKRLTHLDALGSLIWNLSYRMPKDKGYGRYVKQISDRISGTKSDGFRLTYTVLLLEAENQKQTTEDLIDSSTNIKELEKNIIKAYEYYDYLDTISRSEMGQNVVLTQYLNFTTFILSRLNKASDQRQRLEKIPFLQREDNLAWHESLNILPRAISSFDNSAQIHIRTEGWRTQGFLDRKAYTDVMHELWQAIMNLCLEDGFYYRESIDPKSRRKFLTFVPLLEKSINQYLDFFEKYVSLGNLDIVPDNAYYGAVEASQLLADLYNINGPWKKGVHHYEKKFYYWLQSIEIFPFDVNAYNLMADQLYQLGRLDLYKKSLMPLSKKLKQSHVIESFKTQENTKYLGQPLGELQVLIPKIILLAPSANVVHKEGMVRIPEAVIEKLEDAKIEIEEKKGGFRKGSKDDQKISDAIRFMEDMENKEHVNRGDISRIEKKLSEMILLLRQYLRRQVRLKGHTQADIFSISDIFPNQLKTILKELNQLKDEVIVLRKLPNIKEDVSRLTRDYKGIRDALVLETDHPYHKLIREFYHENSRGDLNYLRM